MKIYRSLLVLASTVMVAPCVSAEEPVLEEIKIVEETRSIGCIDVVEEAEEVVAVQQPTRNVTPISAEQGKVFDAVELQAEFPGGMGALMRWLGENLSYPPTAQENNIQGKVIVQFIVEKDGTITSPKILRGVDKDLDIEAIRIVKKMPKWTPGRNNGQVVRSHYILPINFRLQN